MALISDVDDGGADPLEDMGEEGLRTKAEFDVPDIGFEAAQYRRYESRINLPTQASVQLPEQTMSPGVHDTSREQSTCRLEAQTDPVRAKPRATERVSQLLLAPALTVRPGRYRS